MLGSAIINTASVIADLPSPALRAYATTKRRDADFTGALLSSWLKGGSARIGGFGPRGTLLIPAMMPVEKVKSFSFKVPMKRRGDQLN